MELRDREREVEALRETDARLDAELKKADERVSEIVNLYEMTKAMSSTLLFDEILQVFSEFVRKNFKFSSCKLSLSDKIYKIEGTLIGTHLTQATAARREFPLSSQNKKIGILTVEGLKEADVERFLIVSRQFSLEIDKARLYETVQGLAITDGVTGIFGRRYFLEMLGEEFERSLKHNFELAFIMVDLDWFKECNDKFGHLVGDVILREVARVLKQNVREIDLIGRYGGEEFCLFFPETDKTSALIAAERLRAAVAAKEFKAYDETIKMTISAGVSAFPDDAKNVQELIEFADKALYEAKAQGRNRVVAFKGR